MAQRRDKRSDLLNYDRGADWEPPFLKEQKEREQRRKEEEERKRLHPDFRNVRSESRTTETGDEQLGPLDRLDTYAQRVMNRQKANYADPIVDAFQSGLQRSGAGLLNLSADPESMPGVAGDITRAGIDAAREYLPSYADWRDRLAGRFGEARDTLLSDSEANQRNVKAALDRADPGFERQALEAVTDVAGSPVSALSVFGGPMSAGLTAADVYNQEYLNATRAGVDPETARQRALAMSGIEAGVAAIPAGKFLQRIGILKKAGPEALLRDDLTKIAAGTVKTVFGEAAEEGLTQIAQGGVDKLIAETSDIQTNRQFSEQQTVDFWNQVWRATKAGAVGGGALGTPHTAFEVAREAGKLASDANAGNEFNRALLQVDRALENRQAREADRVKNEKEISFTERAQQTRIDEQRKQDEIEAAYRTQERQRQADAMLTRSLDQGMEAGPLQSAMRDIKVTPVTAEDVARERELNAQRTATNQQAVQDATQRNQQLVQTTEAQQLIAKDQAAVEKKAKSTHQAQRRKAASALLEQTRTLEPEQRAQAVAQGLAQWDAANPVENFMQQAAAPTPPKGRAPTRTPVTKQPAPVAEQVTEQEAPVERPQRSIDDLKKELGMAAIPMAQKNEAGEATSSGVTSEKALNTLTQSVGTSDSKKLLKLVADGKMVIVDDISELPKSARDALGPNAAGGYDGQRTYIMANKLNSKNIKGELLSYAAHEFKHAADVSGNTDIRATLGGFVGGNANKAINTKIEKLAQSGNAYAQAAVNAARKGSTPETYSLELPAYFINAMRQKRGSAGLASRVAQDIVSAVRTKYKQVAGDLDVNLDDVAYLSDKLLTQAAVTEKPLTGDSVDILPMILGKSATQFQQVKDAGLTYKSIDGKEKFVVSDIGAKTKEDTGWSSDLLAHKPVKLGDVIDHPVLYHNYPDAENIKLMVDETLDAGNAYWDGEKGHIAVNRSDVDNLDDNALLDLVIHEVQHFIQKKEGHAYGGTPKIFMTNADSMLHEAYDRTMSQISGFQQQLGTKASRERLVGSNEALNNLISTAREAYMKNAMTRFEFLGEVADAILSNPSVPDQAKVVARNLKATVESAKNLGKKVNQRAQERFNQYQSLLGEVEARFSAANRRVDVEDMVVYPEDVEVGQPGSFDVDPMKSILLFREKDGWYIQEPAANATFTGLPANALSDALDRFQKPDNNATRTIANAIKTVGGQLRTYGNLGSELGVLKEAADGEAALHSHRAMNYFSWLNRGVDKMAKQGIKSGKYRNQTEAVTAIKDMVRDTMNKIAAIPDATRREAALAAFVRANPELDGLMAAVQEVNELSRSILKQMIMANPNPTPEELRLMNTIMDNNFRYATQMYAAFQGPAGRAHSQQLIDQHDRAQRLLAQGKQVPEKLRESFTIYKNAMKYLIENDLEIGDEETLNTSSTDKLSMLYDTWVGDATRIRKTVKANGIANGLTRAEADQLVRDTLIAGLLDRQPGINESDYEGKARDLIMGMLELSNEGGPFASYYRGFKQDRSILEQRTGLPDEIKKLFGEITDPATRLAVTIAKQGELVARTRMLLDMRTHGLNKWVIPGHEAGLEGNERFTATLTGENFGPLQGYRTTPEIASAIGDSLEMFTTMGDALAQSFQNTEPAIQAAARSAVSGLRKLAAWQKVATVVFDLYNMGTNFVGSPIALLANGITSPKYIARGAVTGADVVVDAIYTKAGHLSPEFEDAVKYGILDSARVQEIRKTPQRYVKELITTTPKIVNRGMKVLSTAKSGTVEMFAMSDAWVKIVAFQERTARLAEFYKAEGIDKTEDQIKREAADQIKDTNITYSRTPPIVRNLESIGVTTFMPYFVSVPRAIAGNLVLGIKDIIRATNATSPKGKILMATAGIKRVAGANAASYGIVLAMKAVAAAVNGDDDDKVEEMKKLMYPDARFADSFFLGKDANGNPMFARFSRIDPFGPANDFLRVFLDDAITPEEKRKHAVEMLKDMVITNRVVVAAGKAFIDAFDDEDFKDKNTKIEKVGGKAAEQIKDWLYKVPGLDYSDVNSVIQFVDSFTPGMVDMFDPSNRAVSEAKDVDSKILSDIIVYSGGRMDVADPGAAAYRVGKDVKEARDTGRKRLAQGVKTGRSAEALESIFIESAQNEYNAMREAARVYEGMTKGMDMSPRQAATVLKDDASLTQTDIAGIMRNRVLGESDEWVNTYSRMLSKTSLDQRQGQGLTEDEQKQSKERRKAFLQNMKALGYKVRE